MRTAITENAGGKRFSSGVILATGIPYQAAPDVTITKTGTGTYVVRFSPPFNKPEGASATISTAAVPGATAAATGFDGKVLNIWTWNASNVLADSAFDFMATGT